MEKNPSLVVYFDDQTLFTSHGRWLHPLFELEAFLGTAKGIDPTGLLVKDRMVGKAAALLTLRLGIRRVHATTISSLGRLVLETAGAVVSYDNIVERIFCATEQLLLDVEDPEEAYRLVRQRITDATT